MLVRIVKIVGISIALAISLDVVLIATKPYFLDYIIRAIMRARDTIRYEGEDRSMEIMDITIVIILPGVFLISLITVSIVAWLSFSRAKARSKQENQELILGDTIFDQL